MENTPVEPSLQPVKKMDKFDQLKKILKKVLIISGIFLLGLITLLMFLYFTKLDRNIFPIIISGNVKDIVSDAPVGNVAININNQKPKQI